MSESSQFIRFLEITTVLINSRLNTVMMSKHSYYKSESTCQSITVNRIWDPFYKTFETCITVLHQFETDVEI